MEAEQDRADHANELAEISHAARIIVEMQEEEDPESSSDEEEDIELPAAAPQSLV